MPRHQQGNVSFEVPRHWEDKTIVAFSSPSRSAKEPSASFVMTRDTLLESDTLASYADRQLSELSKRVDGFNLLEKREVQVGGARAMSLRFESKALAGPLVQRLVVVEDRRRAVVCFTATAPKSEAAQIEPLFDRMITGVRFDPPSGQGQAA
ncbi:MAG: DcrB-related protein [Polyangiaceae bacterium]|nr:DcrB-related protein [Polyangiaceae bacterium]